MRAEDRAALREQLKLHEGVRRFPYHDTVGKLTIGVGRNLDDVGLSDAEIDLMLTNDINRAIDGLVQRVPWFESLDGIRQRVLVDLAFNMGVRRLLGFMQMLAALERHDYDRAADELKASKWFGQVGERGPRLVAMLRTGVA